MDTAAAAAATIDSTPPLSSQQQQQLQQMQQQQQQPASSLPLLRQVLSDLQKYNENNSYENMEEPIFKAAEAMRKQFETVHSLKAASKTLQQQQHQELTSHRDDAFKPLLRSFLSHAVESRIALSHLIHLYLTSVQTAFEDSQTCLEEDSSGYYAACLLTFNEIFDKIIETQISAVKDIQTSYRVIVTNASYPPHIQRSIASKGNLYLIRNHSVCPSCKAKPPVARALLQNTPLCQDCLDKEKETLFSHSGDNDCAL